ncbi:MAG: DNA internalization-related competence protein ComEC/Rec2 [Halioglobus sp.]|jgi:competence protein ComEC
MRSWLSGIVLGILPVSLLPRLPDPWMVAAMAAGGLVLLRRGGVPHRFCSGLALGAALAIAHGHALLRARLPEACVGQYVTLQGTVSSLPRLSTMRDGRLRQRFELVPDHSLPARCAGPRRILLSLYGGEILRPGDRWRFEARLRRPWGLANPGSFNMQSWFAQSGIDAVGSIRSASAVLLEERASPWRIHHRLRGIVSLRLADLPVGSEVSAMLRAVTVADKSGIDGELWSLLQQFGVNHLLVISGLHIALVAGLGYLLAWPVVRLSALTGRQLPWAPGLLALGLATAYAALAGFSVATQRALSMLACFIVADLAGRRSGSADTLLLAAAVVLVLNPLAGLGSGFWLSFGAVAALLWLSCWQRGTGRSRRVLVTHAFMALVMLPMGGWWFGGSSLVSAVANLVMVPLVGSFVVPLALLGALLCLLGLPGDLLAWKLAAWPLQQLLPPAVRLVEQSPAWLYYHLSPGLTAVLLAIPALALGAVPAGVKLRLLAAVLLLPLLLPAADRAPGTVVTVLDVGQGTAVVVRAGARTLLYDTGGGNPAGSNMASSVVLPYLRSRGITALETLVVSHADEDHSAGLDAIRRAMPVRQLRVGPGLPALTPGGRVCRAGEAWRWPGGQTFRFLSPAGEAGLSSNNGSCVLQVIIGDYHLLIPGDIERRRELTLVRYWGRELRSDWLLAAHHGSATSSAPALVKTVRPETVVFNSGYANRFGHPHESVVRRFRRHEARLLSTAEAGAVELLFLPGQPPVVTARRALQRRFWM